VVTTDYVEPGEALPAYEVGAPDLPGPEHPLRAPLLAGGGGAAVLAGALYGLAWVARSNYYDSSVQTEAQLNTLRTQTNTLCIGSAIAGGVALSLGAGAVIVK
jgi:hypothetical protein